MALFLFFIFLMGYKDHLYVKLGQKVPIVQCAILTGWTFFYLVPDYHGENSGRTIFSCSFKGEMPTKTVF